MSKLTKEELLEARRKMKDKKPEFIRQDSHKKSEVPTRWRTCRGKHSKMRQHKRGYRKSPTIGYRSPAEVRGLHTTGLKQIIVYAPEDLIMIDRNNEGAVIASSVGLRKRIEIVKKAAAENIMLLNVKGADAFIKEAEKRIAERKERKKKKTEGKESRKKGKEAAEKSGKEEKEGRKEEKKEGIKKEHPEVQKRHEGQKEEHKQEAELSEEEQKEAERREEERLLIKRDK